MGRTLLSVAFDFDFEVDSDFDVDSDSDSDFEVDFDSDFEVDFDSNCTIKFREFASLEIDMATATITPDQNAVIAEIFIAAPPARVFQAISDPAQLPKWWGQSDLYQVTKSTMDVRPGGKWRSEGVGADGQSFYVEGEYLEVDPPRLLVHTWVGSYEGPHAKKTIVRWQLEPHSVHGLHPSGPKKSGTGTLVRVRQEGFAGNLESATSHGDGWKRVLGWLEAFVENPSNQPTT